MNNVIFIYYFHFKSMIHFMIFKKLFFKVKTLKLISFTPVNIIFTENSNINHCVYFIL